jgi:hypothetical protein
LIPGAPAQKTPSPAPADARSRVSTQAGPHREAGKPAQPAAAAAPPAPPPEPKGPPLSATEIGDRIVIVFPPERFDLDVAAALGKGDWDAVLRRSDKLSGATRDKIHRHGAAWVAPLEFLSEVFVDGKPLTRGTFDQDARQVRDGVRALEVHFPRFGPVTLIDVAGKGRFVSTLGADAADRVAELVAS